MPERTIRRAYNVVITPEGERIAPALCIFDSSGVVTSVERLTAELPFVEWIGGKLDLSV